jgi:hypothetical protein
VPRRDDQTRTALCAIAEQPHDLVQRPRPLRRSRPAASHPGGGGGDGPGYNVPSVADNEYFWSDNYYSSDTSIRSLGVRGDGGALDSDVNSTYEVVCVTTPST